MFTDGPSIGIPTCFGSRIWEDRETYFHPMEGEAGFFRHPSKYYVGYNPVLTAPYLGWCGDHEKMATGFDITHDPPLPTHESGVGLCCPGVFTYKPYVPQGGCSVGGDAGVFFGVNLGSPCSFCGPDYGDTPYVIYVLVTKPIATHLPDSTTPVTVILPAGVHACFQGEDPCTWYGDFYTVDPYGEFQFYVIMDDGTLSFTLYQVGNTAWVVYQKDDATSCCGLQTLPLSSSLSDFLEPSSVLTTCTAPPIHHYVPSNSGAGIELNSSASSTKYLANWYHYTSNGDALEMDGAAGSNFFPRLCPN